MNRATLNELQRQRCYPSITMLINTTPGAALTPSELDTAARLTGHTDGDISDTLRHNLKAMGVPCGIAFEPGNPPRHSDREIRSQNQWPLLTPLQDVRGARDDHIGGVFPSKSHE